MAGDESSTLCSLLSKIGSYEQNDSIVWFAMEAAHSAACDRIHSISSVLLSLQSDAALLGYHYINKLLGSSTILYTCMAHSHLTAPYSLQVLQPVSPPFSI